MKTPPKQLLALLLCGCCLLTACGAPAGQASASSAAQAPAPTQNTDHELVLAYAKQEGFNPYLSTNTLVLQCAQLLYANLVTIKDDFSLEYLAAASVQPGVDSVRITPGSVVFADGSRVSAADIAASIEAARASALYGSRFSGVTGVRVEGDAVVVSISEPDVLFAYLLDIPVMKAGQTGEKQPMASGRYSVGPEGNTLVANASFAEKTPFDTITLNPVTAYDAIVSGVNMGTLSLYVSEQDADLAGNNICKTAYYNLNHLVFLGINAADAVANQPAVRSALNLGVSRRQIADKAYYSRAYVATTLANSRYPFLEGAHTLPADADTAAAKAQIETLGYTYDSGTGYYQDASGKRLSLELLCYSGNTFKRYLATLVKEQLKDCGVEINVVEENDFAAYHEKIASGQFSLYIGEVKLYNNINMSPFFSAAGDAHYGIVPSEALLGAYRAAKADLAAYGAFEQAFAAELPFLPLIYKNGVVTYTKQLKGFAPTLSDAFYGFEQVSSVPAKNKAGTYKGV